MDMNSMSFMMFWCPVHKTARYSKERMDYGRISILGTISLPTGV
jgi:hypothetical protein